MTTKTRPPLFERLKKALEDGIAHARGEITLRTTVFPEDPPEIAPEAVAALRALADMSQAEFASLLSVSTNTLQSWEQGRRSPSDASRRLLQILCTDPAVVFRSAGLSPVELPGVEIRRAGKGPSKIVVTGAKRRRPARVPG